MKKSSKLIGTMASVGLLLAASAALAGPLNSSALNTPGVSRTLLLPPAALNAPVIELGSAIDPQTGDLVQGYAFIHHRNENANFGNGRAASNAANSNKCFSYLAKGAKWKTIEPWVMNPTNARSLDENAVFNFEDGAANEWEDAADGAVGDGQAVPIFGSGSVTYNQLTADSTAPDGQNEVYFSGVSDSSVIAVTIVWGNFGGPTATRQLVEWDMIFNQVDFSWSADSSEIVSWMDFDNIATHEIGHAAGLGHPSDTCDLETMYRYSFYGDIIKRDLHTGDIAGINGLY